jgi:hypothetical protein
MNRRNQSGYDPVGDARTGRPPLPEERDRSRGSLPDEINPEAASADESTLGRLASEGGEALRTASDTVTSQVSTVTSLAIERGSELATTASQQLQIYAEQLAAFTRRRPIGALAGAVIVGMLIGLLGRRRS